MAGEAKGGQGKCASVEGGQTEGSTSYSAGSRYLPYKLCVTIYYSCWIPVILQLPQRVSLYKGPCAVLSVLVNALTHGSELLDSIRKHQPSMIDAWAMKTT